MALWRWFTMDTRNPFALRFWTWGNLFGQSQYERVKLLKQEIYQRLYDQIRFSQPNHINASIVCPLTHQSIIHPVITPEGLIYEKYALKRRLAAYDSVPGTEKHLTKDDIYEFNEITGLIKFAEQRKETYQKKVAKLVETAQKVSLKSDKSFQYAGIFTCPLSNKLIRQPVITPVGRVYDYESIKGYLEISGSRYDPIDGTSLTVESLSTNENYENYLKMYHNRAAEFGEQVADVVNNAIQSVQLGVEFIGGFFSKPQIPDEQGKLITRPGMDFKI